MDLAERGGLPGLGRLPDNPTTGYVWEVVTLSGQARRVEAGTAPGVGGRHRLALAFDGTGAVTLHAVHRRS